MSGLTAAQVTQLLRPINPARVGKDGKGFSHVEAYEIRAHLNRVLGFANWSADLTDLALVFQTETAGEKGQRHTVCYRATMRLTVCDPDGRILATYTEAATGDATNQPSQADAHDLAIKTAESQALKRCAINLGDNFGLSLYAKGSLSALVKGTLISPAGAAAKDEKKPDDKPAVDAHLTEQLPPENTPAEDNREVNAKKAVDQPRDTPVDDSAAPTERDKKLAELRDRLLAAPEDAGPPWFARVQVDAAAAGLLKAITDNGKGEVITLAALIEDVRRSRKKSAA